ncbi:MBL fold metallo-hydrolase [Coralliovum pocilloporae]|uniref:MBL fold metallo-hydrolase n=1 Tax=Coralliovum pocilloporae TaxID=3066369 RepID=UPI0033074267
MSQDLSFSRRALLAGATAAAVAPSLSITSSPAIAASSPLVTPTVNQFKLGSFEITTILDGVRKVSPITKVFGIDQPVDDVHTLADSNFLPTSAMAIQFTPVIIKTGKDVVLFDTGNAQGSDGSGQLVHGMKAAGIDPASVTVVVITHMHPDHIGGIMANGQEVFPNARYVTGRVEYDFWSDDKHLSGPTARIGTLVQSNVKPIAEKLSFLENEGDVVTGIKALATFGHTPGHMAYHIESEGQQLLIWGDICNHFVLSLQRPEWHIVFDFDKEAAAKTRRRILDMVATDRIPVTGYHMPFPAVGYVAKHQTSYVWTPASYQFAVK